ncbi:DMT family transporter [Bacillus sp. FJAT-47783]|uniref:DMT family transporter n=1 Tax=Bacillus sp. FJAT-47783 TaxID=2922712 RepID=UPI001FAC770D|nr:DMT family transporter [Bacillus sp. FJAT-47783]
MSFRKVEQMLTNKISVAIIAVFCSILWGSAFPVLKISYEEMGMTSDDLMAKITFAGMRFFLSAVMLLGGMLLFKRQALKLNRSHILYVMILGILSTSLQYFFFYNGLAHTSGMKAAILSSSGIFFVVLFAHAIYHNDKLDERKWIGLVLGFTGIILANWGADFTLQFSFFGEGFLLLSGLVSAFGTFLAKRLSMDIHPFALTGWQMLFGSLVLLIIGAPNVKEGSMMFTPLAISLLLYAAFLSATAFALWFALLKHNKAGEVSMFKFVVPVSGAMLSALFLPSEQVTFMLLIALLFVSSGILVVNRKWKRKTRRVFHGKAIFNQKGNV